MGKARANFYRKYKARLEGQSIRHPRDILAPHRLDIAAKSIFARAYIEGNSSSWPEEIYKQHLRIWNLFYEEDPRKETYKEFKESFLRVIDDSRRGVFKHHISPITLDEDGYLQNGSHRLTTALLLDTLVNVRIDETAKAGVYNHAFFKDWSKTGSLEPLKGEYLDAMTLEYLRLVPNQMYAVIIFPAAEGHRDEAEKRIAEMGDVLNVKEISSKKLDPTEVIRQLYAGEPWNHDGSPGVLDKALSCFSKNNPLKVYLVRSSLTEPERRALKEELRLLWGVEKHSIHMSDTPLEAFRIATMFFHEGTLKNLRRAREFEYLPAFGALFEKYQSMLPQSIAERENYCIDSSGPMGLLGIRDVQDLDYLYRVGERLHDTEDISQHNDHAGWYTYSIDDIISNPKLHFYYNGVKFASIQVVKKMKQRRAEEKDIRDVALINDYLDQSK